MIANSAAQWSLAIQGHRSRLGRQTLKRKEGTSKVNRACVRSGGLSSGGQRSRKIDLSLERKPINVQFSKAANWGKESEIRRRQWDAASGPTLEGSDSFIAEHRASNEIVGSSRYDSSWHWFKENRYERTNVGVVVDDISGS